MHYSWIKPIESVVSGILETASELLNGGNGHLNGVRASVELPRDLFAHTDVQTEWWYYTGHCKTRTGREFGFELVFFKRRTDHDQLGVIPLKMIANPMYAAHFAISEIGRDRFQYEHRRSFAKPFDIDVEMRADRYSLTLGDWSVREHEGSHILHASFGDGLVFDAVLLPTKPAILNGDSGAGISRKGNGAAANHFSLTRMAVSGRFARGHVTEEFTGSAWMDKEFGTWDQKYWDWFSVQMDDGTDLMIYHFRTEAGETETFSHGAFIDSEGTCTHLNNDDFLLRATSEWKSPKTGAEYPSGWKVGVPAFDIDLEIRPLIDDQELDTRGTTMIVYWEGVCSVVGTRSGAETTGRAYVELVGYDRSHDEVSIRDFLFGSTLRKVREIFV